MCVQTACTLFDFFIRENLFFKTLRDLNTIVHVENPELPTNVSLGVYVRRNFFLLGVSSSFVDFNAYAYHLILCKTLRLSQLNGSARGRWGLDEQGLRADRNNVSSQDQLRMRKINCYTRVRTFVVAIFERINHSSHVPVKLRRDGRNSKDRLKRLRLIELIPTL